MGQRNSNAVSYANNLASQPFIDKAILDNKSIYSDAAMIGGSSSRRPNPQNVQRVVTRIWTRVKTGR